MFLPLLLTLAALPVQEAKRPDVVVDPVAQVLVTWGTVSVKPSSAQAAFPATKGTPLQKSDRVIVGAGAWVALAILGNSQVVRLDDDLELQVGELALLNAPKHAQGLQQQFDTLFTAQERQHTERLIGWNASPTAASTPAMEREKNEKKQDQVMEKARREEARDEPLPRQPAPASPPSPRPAVKSAPMMPPPPPPAPPPAEVASAPAEIEERRAPPSGGGAAMPERSRESRPMRQARVALAVDAALTTCLQSAFVEWGPGVRSTFGKSLTVKARRVEGSLQVRLPRGLPTPSCATTWFATHEGLGATWTELTVPLQ